MSKLLAFAAFAVFSFLFRITPFRIIYSLSDFVAWLLANVIKYRRNVVNDNLEKSDLQLDPEQKAELTRKIYLNLSDVLMEGIKSLSMTRKDFLNRHKVLNPEVVQQFFDQKKSVILVTGHIGNWEWGSLSAALYTPYQVVGFYKPLSNHLIDRMVMRSRSKYGTLLAPINKTSLTFQEHINDPALFLMAADQSPVNTKLSNTINFLGRPTYFLHGPEKHARANDLPVVFADILRKKRGFYEVSLSVICEIPSDWPDGHITTQFARKVENSIRKSPESWLWTHRRWKRQPPVN